MTFEELMAILRQKFNSDEEIKAALLVIARFLDGLSASDTEAKQ